MPRQSGKFPEDASVPASGHRIMTIDWVPDLYARSACSGSEMLCLGAGLGNFLASTAYSKKRVCARAVVDNVQDATIRAFRCPDSMLAGEPEMTNGVSMSYIYDSRKWRQHLRGMDCRYAYGGLHRKS